MTPSAVPLHAGEIAVSGIKNPIVGSLFDDRLFGGDADDFIFGQSGDDILRGGGGDDYLYGGDGTDQVYGGEGADYFVIDLSLIDDVDEFMDFSPDEGDSIILKIMPGPEKENDLSTDVSDNGIKVEYDRFTLDNVRLNYVGDLEVKVDDDVWHRVARVKKGNLKIRIGNYGDDVRLILYRPY